MKKLFATSASALGIGLLAWLAYLVFDWAVLHAVFTADANACQALEHQGACWGVIAEKARPILLGYYPYESQRRPLLVLVICAAFALMTWLSAWRRMSARAVSGCIVGGLVLMSVLMHGGIFGLSVVPFDKWGGLPLTLCLFALSLAVSVPIAVGLALARRSSKAWVSWPATTFIEVIRGVPLVTLLFMAAFMLPALAPHHPTPLFWRALLALVLFSAVYLAEVVRGGLQTVAKEQGEAASILGLSWWQTQHLIVLPQAMRAVLPALVGHAIGLLKDSSLVMIIGLHELTGGLGLSLGGDPVWRPYYLEGYLFVGLIYWLMCLGLSRMGRRLEHNWAKGSH
ncbi:MAG: amino acid ABC transporter permease [Aquabacterium sp.]